MCVSVYVCAIPACVSVSVQVHPVTTELHHFSPTQVGCGTGSPTCCACRGSCTYFPAVMALISLCVCVCVRLYVSVRACVAYACLDDHTADWFGLCVSSVLWRVIKWNLKR